jgi:hypothetical protein
MSDAEAELQRVKDACQLLSEHFDSVHIFTTRLKDEDDAGDRGTININYGYGNWFARYGQIHTWVVKQDEQSRKEVRDEQG